VLCVLRDVGRDFYLADIWFLSGARWRILAGAGIVFAQA
jgi:hypothetical protein